MSSCSTISQRLYIDMSNTNNTVDSNTPQEDPVNKSYPVDLNIPVACIGYRIELVNNVHNLTLKSGLTTRMLNGKITEKTILHDSKKIVINMTFTEDQGYLFSYILDRSDITIDELTDALDVADKFFTEYEISRQSQNIIDKYIASLGRYEKTWYGLSTKPDYNLTLFRNRTLPYYDIECKDWVKANIEASKSEYPSEIIRTSVDKSKKTSLVDYGEEVTLAHRYNNFKEWNVLPVDKYPNMDKLVSRILLLARLNMTSQAYTMLMRLMISPKECHVVKSPAIWNWLKPIMATNTNLEEIIKYCYSYAMYILRQEETVMFSNVHLKYRVMFTLEEASSLPTFANSHMEKSPYILQLTDNTALSQTIPFYINGKRSINNKAEFNRRFHIATGGAFKGVDLKSIGAAITGSILIPCVQRSPLENGFEDVDWVRERKSIDTPYPFMIDTPEAPQDIAFANFLEYYYPSYVSLTDSDYEKQVLGIDKKNPTANPELNLMMNTMEEDIKYEDISDLPNLSNTQANPSNTQTSPSTETKVADDQSNSPTTEKPNEKSDGKPKKLSYKKKTVARPIMHTKVSIRSGRTVTSEAKLPSTANTSNTREYDSDEQVEDSEESDKDSNDVKSEVSVSEYMKEDVLASQLDAKEAAYVQPTKTSVVDSTKQATEPITELEVTPVSQPTTQNKILRKEEAENKTKRVGVDYNQLSDIDISITVLDRNQFKDKALKLYEAICKNCNHRGPVHIKEIRTLGSTKYKIYGPGIPRPMDIFCIPYDPAKMVKKFHVHAVKMFYDNDITMFRSCIACLLSGVGETYKWFSCNKVAADVLLKYAQRGMSIILNDRERTALSNYIVKEERWGNMIKAIGIPAEKIYCSVMEKHPFFRPGLYDSGCRKGLRPFEKDTSCLYSNTLTVTKPKMVYPFGEVIFKTSKKINAPNIQLITAAVEYVTNGDLSEKYELEDDAAGAEDDAQ